MLGATLGASSLPAIEPIARKGKPSFQLGLAAYSFRNSFKHMRDKVVEVPEGIRPLDMFSFLDLCQEYGVQGAELTSYFFPPDADEAHFLAVKRHAYLKGVQISGTAIGNVWTHPDGPALDEQIALTKKWIDNAAYMGAPHIRVFAGNKPKASTHEEAVEQCIKTYAHCAEYAAKKGVFLGLENHHGIVYEAKDLLHIVKTIDNPWVGINLDSGNFATEDPYGDLEKCAPYAINVQLKLRVKPKGRPQEAMDIPRFVKIMRDANYQGWFTLEYEEKEDPFVHVPRVLKELRPLLA